jgi:hypothetical protein
MVGFSLPLAEKYPTGEKILKDYISHMGENIPHVHVCSIWECFPHLGEILLTVSNGVSPKPSWRISPKWGKHSQIEHACGIFSPILEK